MEGNGYQWCWHRLQWIAKTACEMRIKKGTCQEITGGQKISAKAAAFFNAEGEIQHCKDLSWKKDSISDDRMDN
jgi:hypothetical protein